MVATALIAAPPPTHRAVESASDCRDLLRTLDAGSESAPLGDESAHPAWIAGRCSELMLDGPATVHMLVVEGGDDEALISVDGDAVRPGPARQAAAEEEARRKRDIERDDGHVAEGTLPARKGPERRGNE